MSWAPKLEFVYKASGPRALSDWDCLRTRVLGRNYELTVVWIGTRRIKGLNRRYRGKDQATNVLAFPLEAAYGEIFLCAPVLRREAAQLGKALDTHATFLFIHALLHLAGADHHNKAEAEKMEHKEKQLLRWYNKSVKRKA
ncbi:MAG: rRNA maturation RNase YbeY [Parcubacteria group bacterium]|nr:rRNA maturation RNase YbeY [Parcubacteria group bacterium]